MSVPQHATRGQWPRVVTLLCLCALFSACGGGASFPRDTQVRESPAFTQSPSQAEEALPAGYARVLPLGTQLRPQTPNHSRPLPTLSQLFNSPARATLSASRQCPSLDSLSSLERLRGDDRVHRLRIDLLNVEGNGLRYERWNAPPSSEDKNHRQHPPRWLCAPAMEGAPCPVFWSRWRRLESGWVREKSGRCPAQLKDQNRSWETLLYQVESAGHR
ncbi:MAG: hypothetical protein VYD19_04890, partial [Myxococcota bacterium]|nr:hypothetical protein [Myxococcota bacterium]